MVYNAHKRIFGFECNPFQVKRLAEYIEDVGVDGSLVVHAMEQVKELSHQYSFKFIVHFLDRYQRQGILKLPQAIEFDQSQPLSPQKGL
ncbi:DnaD domain protein [Paenibacillus antibioticophila]|uniref:DnaD domain protein n=1 Tax=Paenibacillus antibioticophila TaxID=1274374 RepID=UPI0008FF00C5